MNTNLQRLGASPTLSRDIENLPHYSLGRIIAQHHHLYDVQTETKTVCAKLSGKMAYTTEHIITYPAVGDWVLIDSIKNEQEHYMIHTILERKNILKRTSSEHEHQLQVMVSNIDIAFICMALNRDYNLRRLERYLAMVWDSGATPIIILTKSDLSTALEEQLENVKSIAPGVDIILSSLEEPQVITAMQHHIQPNKTAVLLGSSGVGKSTLINRLMGSTLTATRNIRHDGKGKHTTTTRHLFQIPTGGIVIDTPGLRALQLDVGSLEKTFEEISAIITHCKYNNCTHLREPGCAITQALSDNTLSQDRWESYQKLQKEQRYSGLSSKKIETEKITTMFGGKKAYKQKMKSIRQKKFL